jgi:hypothetical protein
MAFLLVACCSNGGSADSIAMGRDVMIAGISGNAMSVTAVPDGGFVVAGSSWAVATDANGGVLWRYADPAGRAVLSAVGGSTRRLPSSPRPAALPPSHH